MYPDAASVVSDQPEVPSIAASNAPPGPLVKRISGARVGPARRPPPWKPGNVDAGKTAAEPAPSGVIVATCWSFVRDGSATRSTASFVPSPPRPRVMYCIGSAHETCVVPSIGQDAAPPSRAPPSAGAASVGAASVVGEPSVDASRPRTVAGPDATSADEPPPAHSIATSVPCATTHGVGGGGAASRDGTVRSTGALQPRAQGTAHMPSLAHSARRMLHLPPPSYCIGDADTRRRLSRRLSKK